MGTLRLFDKIYFQGQPSPLIAVPDVPMKGATLDYFM
jgi:hypothetical protein